jgi:hypothetical protein
MPHCSFAVSDEISDTFSVQTLLNDVREAEITRVKGWATGLAAVYVQSMINADSDDHVDEATPNCWSCNMCTLENEDILQQCRLCTAARPQVPVHTWRPCWGEPANPPVPVDCSLSSDDELEPELGRSASDGSDEGLQCLCIAAYGQWDIALRRNAAAWLALPGPGFVTEICQDVIREFTDRIHKVPQTLYLRH